MVTNPVDNELCIGQIGLSKEEYWNLTPAETYTKIKGYVFNRDVMSSNFRALFSLSYNQNVKTGDRKKPELLWPLASIDNEGKQELTSDEMFCRNKKIEEWYNSQCKN